MKKLFTASLAVLITASMLGGCAAAGGETEHSAQARYKPSAITEFNGVDTDLTEVETEPAEDNPDTMDESTETAKDSSDITEEITETDGDSSDTMDESTEPTVDGSDTTDGDTEPNEDTEATEDSTKPVQDTEPESPETAIATIDQLDELTLTAKLTSENGQVLTVTFCRKTVPGSDYFYVCTEDEAERTEYLYHINGEKLTQYLRVNNSAIRNSDVHSEEIEKVYQEQQELFRTFVNAQTALNPDTTREVKLHPELSLVSILIGNNDVLDVSETDVVYYELAEDGGYAGIHRDTNALVILLNSEMEPMISLTELSLNNSQRMNDLLEMTDSAPLLAPDISFHEELDAFRVDCLIYGSGEIEETEGKSLGVTVLRTEDNQIVYSIQTEQNGEPVTLIYEIAVNGDVTKYERLGENGTFQPSANPNVNDEMKQHLALAAIFTDYTSLLAGCQYEYVSPGTFSEDTGDVVYQVMNGNILKGYIAIDSATGILKSLFDEECQPLLVVQTLETENVVIDDYQ